MNKEIEHLVKSLREKAVGKTCMGTGNYSFDIITQREYPDGFVVGKRNKFEERILKMEIGNTCGNVMTMLPYLGVKTFPVAKFDVSPQGYQMKRDLKAYGADVRYVSNTLGGGTTILRCMHKLDDEGKPWDTRALLQANHGWVCRHVLVGSISRRRVVRLTHWWTQWTSHPMYSSSTWHRQDTGS